MCEQGQLYKVSKSKDGIVKKEKLTKHWTDWVDYWAVDFDYLQRKEIIKVPVGAGLGGVTSLPGFEPPQGELAMQFEERWTGVNAGQDPTLFAGEVAVLPGGRCCRNAAVGRSRL